MSLAHMNCSRLQLTPEPILTERNCEFHELMRLRERSIKYLQPFFTTN